MDGSGKASMSSSGNVKKNCAKMLLLKCLICFEVFKNKADFKDHIEGILGQEITLT